MKLTTAFLGNEGLSVETKKGARWQVIWRLDPGTGAPIKERQATVFVRRRDAIDFIERLRDASVGRDGWILDHAGDPVKAELTGCTVLAAVTDYCTARWFVDWQAKQRTKVRSRLCELIILTVARPADRVLLLAAYEAQRGDRGHRPEPVTKVEWAARWLRDHALLPNRPATDPRVLAGKAWLERESLTINALDVAFASTLRNSFVAGHAYNTGRTYWQGIIVPFVNWLVNSRQLRNDPLLGLPKLRRDMELERPDRREIPEPARLHKLARFFGAHYGELWELWVYVCCFCALRPGESFAITGSSFIRHSDGRWLLDPREQEQHMVAWASDDGRSTRTRKRTKSTRGRKPPPRLVPIPDWLGMRLDAYFGDQLGSGSRLLFVGPRGATAPVDTVQTWFNDAVAALFGDDPYLSSMTAHTLRHAGMTYWFAGGADEKRVQEWGGWRSLKEMQDTYRGVIRSLQDEQFENIDAFCARFATDLATPTKTEPPGTGHGRVAGDAAVARVVNLKDYRRTASSLAVNDD